MQVLFHNGDIFLTMNIVQKMKMNDSHQFLDLL